MYELLNIEVKDGKQLVSARELHGFLEVTERFQQWFDKRVKKYEFVNGVDFTSVKTFTVVNNGAKKEIQDYAITIEMAKELSMVQDNTQGKIARKYFIQCERIATSLGGYYMEHIKDLTLRLDRTEKLIGLRCKQKFDYGRYIKNKMCIHKANSAYENVKMVLFAELGVSKWEDIDYSLDVIMKIDEVLEVLKLDRQMSLLG